MQLPVLLAPQFKVVVGNREQLECEGEAKRFPIVIQGHTRQITTYLLPIATTNLVLGTQWLALGTHLVNYNCRFITFYLDGTVITLHGEQ